jgi:hypothetical protein
MNDTPVTTETDDDYEVFGAAPLDAQKNFRKPEREEGESDDSYGSRLRKWLNMEEINDSDS